MPHTDMLINFVPGEECRIALVADGRLEEYYQERASAESHVGNIYKARVANVEPAIQAAFVDFGLERNGFLHISDLHPMYFPGDHKEETEQVGLKTPRRQRPPIQRCLRRGQEILVQVLKEGIGTKGPTVTSYLSIPGRYLVMMPYMERMGVSRKIEDDDARRESRQILQELNPPEGFGFIIRTAGIGRPKTELKRDLAYLVRLWKTLEKRMKATGDAGELYTESDLLIRTLRDVFTSDVSRIIVDDAVAARRAHDFLAVVSPRSSSSVFLYNEPVPLFHRFGIEPQIENIHARTVALPSGGSLVIDQAEALVAIDVNSGKYRDNRDAEMTAYKTDLEACDEVCRQLRLRDLGGVVVVDMIDMHQAKHRRDVEQRFRNNLKRDRARTQVLPISRFGMIEMTRQRMRPSLTKSTFTPCTYCQGQGQVKTPETVVLEVTRRLALAMQRRDVARLDLTVSPDVAFQLLNRKRTQLVAMEQRFGKPVMVRVHGGGAVDFIDIACFDARGGALPPEVATPQGTPELEAIQTGMDDLSQDELAELTEADASEPTDRARESLDTPQAPDTAETAEPQAADDDDTSLTGDEDDEAPAQVAQAEDADHDAEDDPDAPTLFAAASTNDEAPVEEASTRTDADSDTQDDIALEPITDAAGDADAERETDDTQDEDDISLAPPSRPGSGPAGGQGRPRQPQPAAGDGNAQGGGRRRRRRRGRRGRGGRGGGAGGSGGSGGGGGNSGGNSGNTGGQANSGGQVHAGGHTSGGGGNQNNSRQQNQGSNPRHHPQGNSSPPRPQPAGNARPPQQPQLSAQGERPSPAASAPAASNHGGQASNSASTPAASGNKNPSGGWRRKRSGQGGSGLAYSRNQGGHVNTARPKPRSASPTTNAGGSGNSAANHGDAGSPPAPAAASATPSPSRGYRNSVAPAAANAPDSAS